MGHLQLAYHLFVIIIGFIALSIAGFWAQKTREAYLRDFCVLYILFNAVLILTVISQYLVLNIENYSILSLYWIMGIKQVNNFAIVVAALRLFMCIYQIKESKKNVIGFLILLSIASVFMFTPIGVSLNIDQANLRLGIGYQIAAVIYFLSFTFMLVFGFANLGKVRGTRLLAFVIGLLVFASVGYLETVLSMVNVIVLEPVVLTDTDHFLFSSIPFALYGIFLVYYFLNTPLPSFLDLSQMPESFFVTYSITDRERELIQYVLAGKSNAEIAEALVISLATVKTHLHNIYRKLDIDSRYDLIARVRQGK